MNYVYLLQCADDTLYKEIFGILDKLNLYIYTPSYFILPSRIAKYEEISTKRETRGGISQLGREQGIRRLMSINLLKRLECSVYAFRLTVERIRDYIHGTIDAIDNYRGGQLSWDMMELSGSDDNT